MLNELMTYLQNFFMDYGSLGVFLGSFIEEVIAPIPSTLIILGSSFFMMQGAPISIGSIVSLILYVSIPAALGLTLGSLFLYAIGYYIGKPFITRWGKYMGFSWEDVEKTQQKFAESKNDDIALFSLRAIPIVPSIAISTFCGIIRYKIKNYILITFLGSIVRASILGFIGWQFGRFYLDIADQLAIYEDIFIIGFIIGLGGYILYKKYGNSQNQQKH
jgi:membrane protein DedA with SNARE-associated domain